MKNKGLLTNHFSYSAFILRLMDWLAVLGTGFLSHYLYFSHWSFPVTYNFPLIIAFLVFAWFGPRFSIYKRSQFASLLDCMKNILLAWSMTFILLILLAFMTKTGAYFSRMWIGVWFLLGSSALLFIRLGMRYFLNGLYKQDTHKRKIVIVGAMSLGQKVAERINATTWMGLQLMGYFCDRQSSSEPLGDIPVLGSHKDLFTYIEQNEIDEVWLAMPLKDEDKVKSILHDLRHSTVSIRYVPDIFGFRLLNHSFTEMAGLPVLNLSVTPMDGTNLLVKDIEDKLLSLFILIGISPIICLIALGIKVTSKGPVFYRQQRVSWNGESFSMLKFRSMPVDVESKTGAVWAKAHEGRATAFGHFLRRTSLDELPQFINVLKGEMSIVGPRPERPIFVEKFKEEIPDYMKKHLVKGGITGWAQINGWRGDTDLEKRIEYDLYYIENWSLWLDLKIILLTVFRGFVHKNAY